MKSLLHSSSRRWIQTQWIRSISLILSRPEQHLDDPKRVEQAFKDSAKLGMVKTGVFEYFGSGQSRLSKLKEFDSVGLSLIVHSVGSLLKSDAIEAGSHLELFDDLIKEVISPERLSSFDHLSFAQILNGLIPFKNIKAHQIQSIVKAFCKKETLVQIDAKTLSSILNSLAKLQYQEEEPIGKICCQAVLRRKWMGDQELATVFWSFGMLQFKEVPQLDLLAAEMIHPRLLSAYTAQALANILVSCARLNYKNAKLLEFVLKEALLPFRLAAYDAQHLANITWALGKLKIRNVSALEALAQASITKSRIRNFNALQICNTYTGWAWNDYSNSEAFHVLFNRLMDPLQGIIEELTPQLLARLAWALSKLEDTTEQNFEALMELITFKKRIPHYNNQDLSNILFACGKRRFLKTKLSLSFLELIICPERLTKYNDQQLANITWSLGEMGVRDERIFRLLARSIIQSSTIFKKPSQLMMVLNGWAHGHFYYQEGLTKIQQELIKPHTLDGLLPRDLRSILWCLRTLKFNEGFVISILEDRLPKNNKGVYKRQVQRLTQLEAHQWPELFTNRKKRPVSKARTP